MGIDPKKFSYSAVLSFRSGKYQCAIIAPSMDDLKEAWYRVVDHGHPLDESRVQRVSIGKMKPATNLLTLNSRLRNFAAFWELDGDILRCRKCKRGIIATRHNEDIQHHADCEARYMVRPWTQLREMLP